MKLPKAPKGHRWEIAVVGLSETKVRLFSGYQHIPDYEELVTTSDLDFDNPHLQTVYEERIQNAALRIIYDHRLIETFKAWAKGMEGIG